MAGAKAGGKTKSSTPVQKDRRARCWARGEKRKSANADEQRKAAERNRETRRSGGHTPWEIACEARAESRRRARMAGGGKS